MGKKKKVIRARRAILKLLVIVILGMCTTNYLINKFHMKSAGYFIINDYDKVVVNKNYVLTSDYKPKDLVPVNIDFLPEVTEEERYMTAESAKAVEEMVDAASKDGIYLYGLSGYRSYATQKNLYEYNVETQGKSYSDKYVAKPGVSEHQLGEAMDLATSSGWINEGCPEANWIANNAYKYGFIVRYEAGKEDITGYNYEPWHVRYVGNEMAEKIYNDGITLEEFAEIN
ncbi:M15 family metallopeptidase [uncultured Clostridium sp.]|uniref:M15 family metallopeptidase n=1 Tax=uncultured Clostridium sp. TaxID=59620 RepID=UPI0032164BBF